MLRVDVRHPNAPLRLKGRRFHFVKAANLLLVRRQRKRIARRVDVQSRCLPPTDNACAAARVEVAKRTARLHATKIPVNILQRQTSVERDPDALS